MKFFQLWHKIFLSGKAKILPLFLMVFLLSMPTVSAARAYLGNVSYMTHQTGEGERSERLVLSFDRLARYRTDNMGGRHQKPTNSPP